jgi:hypothetical protein
MPGQNSPTLTKSLLFELTSKILGRKADGAGVVSAEVVDEFLREHSVPEDEVKEVTRIGLMVLAGKVTTLNRSDAGQLDIFERENFPIFVDLRTVGVDGKYRTQRYDVRKLTPNAIVMHSPPQPKNKTISKRDHLISWAEKRVASGDGDVAVKDST